MKGNMKKIKIKLKPRYVIVAVCLLVVCAGGAFYWQYSANVWNRAQVTYKKADYRATYDLIKKLPMPSDNEKLMIYGQAMLSVGEKEKAKKAFNTLYARNKDPFVKMLLGNIYNQDKDYDGAEKTYKEIIADNPNYVQAYVNLATLYRLRNDQVNALKTAQDGIKNNPKSVVLLELVVSLNMDNQQSKEFTDAVKSLKEVDPENKLLKDIMKT
jgi:tetratricopeptide (TPR) repeat protein